MVRDLSGVPVGGQQLQLPTVRGHPMTQLDADLAAERYAGVVRELQAALDTGEWTALEQLRHRAELLAALKDDQHG
jgi:hypothetical protein